MILEVQSWRDTLGSSLVRHRSWLAGSNEEDVGLGIDAVGDDEREGEDAEAYHQGEELKLFAGDEKYPGTDVLPAALSPCGVFGGAPLTQFEGRGQGPGQPCRGTHTAGQPVRLVGIQGALNP